MTTSEPVARKTRVARERRIRGTPLALNALQEARPVTRIFLIALILAAIAATPLVAQEAGPASFFIGRIEARNAKRVSADVVVAESNLREGREYTEPDLRDAANRLSRLPFLLSAEFSLEKGVERGRHVLVITLSET